MKRPLLKDHLLKNVYFDTCVYHQPGIDLLLKVIPADNILFASEMVGAVRGIDPETGHLLRRHQALHRRQQEPSVLPTSRKIFEGNALRTRLLALEARLSGLRAIASHRSAKHCVVCVTTETPTKPGGAVPCRRQPWPPPSTRAMPVSAAHSASHDDDDRAQNAGYRADLHRASVIRVIPASPGSTLRIRPALCKPRLFPRVTEDRRSRGRSFPVRPRCHSAMRRDCRGVSRRQAEAVADFCLRSSARARPGPPRRSRGASTARG